MGVETGVSDISDLVEAWPLDTEELQYTDDHLRNIKTAIRGSFSELASTGGAVAASATEFNYLSGVIGNIQGQIDTLDVLPAWTQPSPTGAPTGGYEFELVKNTRVLVYANIPLRNRIDVFLPPVSGLSDGDFVHIAARETAISSSTLFRIRLLASEPNFQARQYDGSWASVAGASSRPFDPGIADPRQVRWPVIFCTYNTTESVWRVWCERGEFNA